MNKSGWASRAAWRIIFWTLVLLLAVFAAGVLATLLGTFIAAVSTVLITVWVLFAVFTLYFFRDPQPTTPSLPNVIVSPAHGRIDLIEETLEPQFMSGACRRISIAISLLDVHVQRAPVSGKVAYVKHTSGEFRRATLVDASTRNENVLIGLLPTESPWQKVAVRLIAGVVTRRILPWVEFGDTVGRSEQIGLIQYGSRCEVYLPVTVKIQCKVGEKVRGGETIVAAFD